MTELYILTGMRRFNVATIVLATALLPIGVGFAFGCAAITSGSLNSLFPESLSGDEWIKGWPENAQELLRHNLGLSRLFAIAVTESVGFLLVVVLCAILGALRLQVARVTAWSLVAAVPLSLVVLDLRSANIRPSDYVITTFAACACLVAWWIVRWATERWFYSSDAIGSLQNKRQIAVFAVLASAILLASIFGWFWIWFWANFSEAFSDVQWMVI